MIFSEKCLGSAGKEDVEYKKDDRKRGNGFEKI